MTGIKWEVVDMNSLNGRRGRGRENGGYEYRWMKRMRIKYENEWMNENEWMDENEWREGDMIWGEGLD